jgi:hypothetical protein
VAGYKKPPAGGWLKMETNMTKPKVQFGSETRFDQPIRRITRTPGAAFAGHPGFVAHSDHHRTAEADQARIDLLNCLAGSSS